jgi:ABC-type lipoprotein release transport system permease subunit
MIPVFLATDLLAVWILTVFLALLAGLYPAWRAARIPPMMALRRD